MFSPSNKFRWVTASSLAGLGVIALLSTTESTVKYSLWWTAQDQKTQAETAKQVADAYAKNQIADFEQLVIENYTFNNTPPQLDWQHSVNPKTKTVIYDKYRRCVGYAIKGKFFFTLYYQGVCSSITPISRK